MHRIFVTSIQPPEISGSDAHHLRDVLRLKAGDPLELLDGSGKVYDARIVEINKERIICRSISSRPAETEPRLKITLAQAIPKSSKMDFIIEKCTELGVNKIIPLLTERTVKMAAKLERWRKIAKSAAQQSGRCIIPEIAEPLKFGQFLKLRGQYDLALIAWEGEKENTLKKSLQSPLLPPIPQILVLIGPEGGFTSQEIELAKAAGFTPVSLGKTILRTETAGLAALAAIMYQFT